MESIIIKHIKQKAPIKSVKLVSHHDVCSGKITLEYSDKHKEKIVRLERDSGKIKMQRRRGTWRY